ncbi:hypothetical protein DFJ63DRAFT_310366 [Scheffersomyces coipomensis]|uniref:uncharacterized protein n=1 Tax=Scheffersomyces coipomensis TaxID=1788519 RepID=UPI00315DC3A3
MIRINTITLHDTGVKNNDDSHIEDVQLWYNQSNASTSSSSSPIATTTSTPVTASINSSYSRLPIHINYRLIPIYLITCNPYHVYSNIEQTKNWFKSNLLFQTFNVDENISLIFKSDDSNSSNYLIFYFDTKLNQIFSIILDFSLIDQINNLISDLPTTTSSTKNDSNTTVFDKVLQRKKSRASPFLVDSEPLSKNQFTSNIQSSKSTIESPSSASSSILTTQDQVNSAINKLILSGLRIRGFSTNNLNHNINDKLNIKEIYQMTYKSTLFSLRKFNYSFINDKLISKKDLESSNLKQTPIKLIDLQDIIEKLLQLFIDVDDQNV